MAQGTSHGPLPMAPALERMHLIDSVRAFALAGVIVYNITAMVGGFLAEELLGDASALDLGAAAFILFAIQGKARACFALLFGVGFGILMERATAREQNFTAFYLRRMAVLLAIGLFNLSFLFWGDILILYALLGVALLPFRRMGNRRLLALGFGLILVPPLAQGLLELALGGALPNLAGLSPAQVDALLPNSVGAYRENSFVGFVAANWRYYLDGWRAHTADQLVYAASVFGLFLIGLVVARNAVFADVERWRPLLRRTAAWCLPIGIVLSLVQGSRRLGVDLPGPLHALPTVAYAGLSILSFGYIALLCLWLTRRGRRLQPLLAPAGRMALTGYLGSNAIGAATFYGWGLATMDRWSAAGLFMFGFAIFTGLCVAASIWLGHFRFGPAEWLWRSLTYGRAQPMQQRQTEPNG